MDSRPIGVFDSGLGGLTAVRELMRLLPKEEIVYFGDTGRVPYGTRSREIIAKYTDQDIRFLKTFDVKAVVVACGTASTNADLEHLCQVYRLPIQGVVLPAVHKAAQLTRNKRVGLVATPASVRSGAYRQALETLDPTLTVVENACPLFVPAVEAGRFLPGDPLAELLTQEYLTPLRDAGIDTLILGCTHYPLLAEIISNFMGDGVALVSPGAEAAAHLAQTLDPAPPRPDGIHHRFFVSDSTESFASLAALFLQGPVEGSVEKIEIERY